MRLASAPRWRFGGLIKQLCRFIAARHWLFRVGALTFLAVILMSVGGTGIAPHDPTAQALLNGLAPPSATHWLGTDKLGRDLLSRIMVGGQFAILIAGVTLLLSAAIGTLVGVMSARAGGMVDELTMRLVDLLISFPDVVVALLLIALLGMGPSTLIIALTAVGWTPFARLARGLALEIGTKDFVRAAEILGCSRAFIILHHIIPNVARPIAAVGFLRFGHKLITVGGLSFIGLGVQPPQADWAAMMAEAQPYIERAPLTVICPGLAIFITALSVTWIGQGLELTRTARSER